MDALEIGGTMSNVWYCYHTECWYCGSEGPFFTEEEALRYERQEEARSTKFKK